jgi:hypothetical protein
MLFGKVEILPNVDSKMNIGVYRVYDDIVNVNNFLFLFMVLVVIIAVGQIKSFHWFGWVNKNMVYL